MKTKAVQSEIRGPLMRRLPLVITSILLILIGLILMGLGVLWGVFVGIIFMVAGGYAGLAAEAQKTQAIGFHSDVLEYGTFLKRRKITRAEVKDVQCKGDEVHLLLQNDSLIRLPNLRNAGTVHEIVKNWINMGSNQAYHATSKNSPDTNSSTHED